MNTLRFNRVARAAVLAFALALLSAFVFANASFASGGGQSRWIDHEVTPDDVARGDDHYVASFGSPGSVTPSCVGGGNESYSRGDAKFYEPHGPVPCWAPWFDATNSGLPSNTNINALHDECGPNDDFCGIFLSFLNTITVPGVGAVQPQDIVLGFWDGMSADTYVDWLRIFDGSDVGLSGSGEKIDGLYAFDPDEEPEDLGCVALLLISTEGAYRVTDQWGGVLSGSGEDVLGFCGSSFGDDTAGYWFLYHDGSAEGAPANSIIGLTHEDGRLAFARFEFLTKGAFHVDGANGGDSEVYNFFNGVYDGPTFSFPDEAGTTDKVDSFTVYHTE